MGILEKIEQIVGSIKETVAIIQKAVAKIESSETSWGNVSVYINTEEASRLLGISSTTLGVYQKCGLVKAYTSRHNKFLANEILWLRGQPHKGASKEKTKVIVEAMKERFGK